MIEDCLPCKTRLCCIFESHYGEVPLDMNECVGVRGMYIMCTLSLDEVNIHASYR